MGIEFLLSELTESRQVVDATYRLSSLAAVCKTFLNRSSCSVHSVSCAGRERLNNLSNQTPYLAVMRRNLLLP